MNRLWTYINRNSLPAALAGMLALFLVAGACSSNDTPTQPPDESAAQVMRIEERVDQALTKLEGSYQASNDKQSGIWVTGVGRMTAAPDIATISGGVEAVAKTVPEALGMAAEAMDALMKALTARGIEERDIQTTRFSIYPEYQYDRDKDRSELVGYRVNNQISVAIRNLDQVGMVIDDMVGAGGDLARFNGIHFGLDDPKPLEVEARKLAVEDMTAKAMQLADNAGVSLGDLVFISESVGASPRVDDILEYATLKAVQSTAVDTPISGGELSVTIAVQGVFNME